MQHYLAYEYLTNVGQHIISIHPPEENESIRIFSYKFKSTNIDDYLWKMLGLKLNFELMRMTECHRANLRKKKKLNKARANNIFEPKKHRLQLWEISVREKSMFRFDSEIFFKGKNPINRFHCIFVVQEILFHCDLRFVDIPNHDFSHLHLCDAMRITRLPNHHKMIFIVRTIEFSMVNAHRTF